MPSLTLSLTDFRWNVWKGKSLKRRNGSIYIWVGSDRALTHGIIKGKPVEKDQCPLLNSHSEQVWSRKSLQSVFFSLSLWVICSVWGRITGNKWGRALRSINFRRLTSVNRGEKYTSHGQMGSKFPQFHLPNSHHKLFYFQIGLMANSSG